MKIGKSFFIQLLLLSLVLQWIHPVIYASVLSDEDLINLIEKKSFNYFWNEANPENGLVRDKAFNFKAGGDPVASIAAVGFALTAYPIGVERGWITRKEAYDRTLKTLNFFLYKLDNVHGFFFHFVSMENGKRVWNSEISSIDTALFLAGALFAGNYFKGTEVESLANQIYQRVDFPWMLNGGKTLSMGWKPEGGFLKMKWDSYNENMILYFLAIGSPTFPIPADSWRAVTRKIKSYGSYVLIASPPLFTHQYSHCWIDFRGITDGHANYFKNSMMATLVNRAFCLDQRDKYKTYSENVWGLTASDGPGGYIAYGSGPGDAVHDGTVAPTAAISSIVFTPELSISVARELYERHKELLWGRYGFADAFNLDVNWKSLYVIGIDAGPMLLMIENYRTGFVWKQFMQITAIQKAIKDIGFRPGDEVLRAPKTPVVSALKAPNDIKIDGNFQDWKAASSAYMNPRNFIEYGEIDNPKDLSAEFKFQWDARNLYFYCRVRDDSFVFTRKHSEIHQDDLVELFIDPVGDGFRWNNEKHFQFGFSLDKDTNELKIWLWPHAYDPVEKMKLAAFILRMSDGYAVEVAIPWSLFGIIPHQGMELRATPAVHDMDIDGSEGKITWNFSKKSNDAFELGKVILK